MPPHKVPDISIRETPLPFELGGQIIFEGFAICIWMTQDIASSMPERRLEHALIRIRQGQNDNGSVFHQVLAVGGKSYKRFWANLNPLSLKINGKISKSTTAKICETDPERMVGTTVQLESLEGANYRIVFWNLCDADKFVDAILLGRLDY